MKHELIRNGEMPIVIPEKMRTVYFEYLANYDVKGLASMIIVLQEVKREKMNAYLKDTSQEA